MRQRLLIIAFAFSLAACSKSPEPEPGQVWERDNGIQYVVARIGSREHIAMWANARNKEARVAARYGDGRYNDKAYGGDTKATMCLSEPCAAIYMRILNDRDIVPGSGLEWPRYQLVAIPVDHLKERFLYVGVDAELKEERRKALEERQKALYEAEVRRLQETLD